MTATATARRPRDVRPVLLFFIFLTIAALIGQTWWAIVQDRRLTIESEQSNSLVTARALEQHATQAFAEIDHVVAAIADVMEERANSSINDPLSLHRILVKAKEGRFSIAALWIVNLKGFEWASTTRSPASEIDVTERQYVKFLNAHPERREAVIGLPVRANGLNEWTIPIARNLYDHHHRRVGIIGGSIRSDFFANFYTRLTDGKLATVTLRTNIGNVLVRTPLQGYLPGQDISKTSIVKRINAGPSEGSFEDKSVFDGNPRLFTYRKAPDFPITIVYAVPMEHVLGPWQNRSVHRILFTGATVLLIGILTFFVLLHIRRFRESEHSRAASEDRYRLLYEGATDAILVLNRNQEYVDCNGAAVKLFGVTGKQDIIGKSAGDFSPPRQPTTPSSRADRQRLIELALAGYPQQVEWAITRNGKLHFNEITLSRANVENEPLTLCIFRDINARKHAEEMQMGQNRILHLIAAGADLQKILNEIALFIEQHAPDSHCMMLLLNDDQSHFTWGAGPNIPEGLIHATSGMRVIEGNSVCSDAVVTQCPVMVADINSYSCAPALRDLLIANGFNSCSCWPIMGIDGQILGALTILHAERGAPTGEDARLAGISTDLASIAIESRWAEQRIRHLAHYDELSGLPNRFLYIEYLNKALARAERGNTLVGVLFLDLDRFKNINDTFGHEAGNMVLRNVSAGFRECLRDGDIIARVGGDEFIVLVDDYSDPRDLREIAQRLLIAAAKPFDIDGHECQLSASIGIVTYPLDGQNEQSLLKNADIAMYRAKSTGKNNYQFYSSEMNTHTVERLALETRLRRAVDRREFLVYYQPKINVRSGQVVGAEALVRWNDPHRGILLPSTFIGLAEEAGLIGALGMQVLDIACRDITAFNKAGIVFGRVAINLSGSQFNDANLLDDVKKVIEFWQVPPTSLEFEITESMVMHNRDQAIALMDGILALGFSLSIDDFGTGYSSLAYLKRFPVDSVKIDKSFVNDIPQDPNDAAIVQAIIVMAHILGLKVTAEGVETITQLETLEKYGCDEYQGFYFSKAVPADEFICLLQNQGATMPT